MQINEELTPLNLEREGCQAVGAYLRRRDAWRGLRTQAESQSQRQLQRVTGFNRRVFAKWWDRLENFLRKVVHTPPPTMKALYQSKPISDGCSGSEFIESAVSVSPARSAESAGPSGVAAETEERLDQSDRKTTENQLGSHSMSQVTHVACNGFTDARSRHVGAGASMAARLV